MKKYDVVIIGWGPEGVSYAISAKNAYPNKNVVLIRKEKQPIIPCGIPYIINTLQTISDNILPDTPLAANNVEIITGDCAAKYDFFTYDYSNTMLTSIAMAEGRLVGSNLYSIKVIRNYQGALGTFSTKIGNVAFAVSGMTESRAKRCEIDYNVGFAKSIDRHPGKLPGASEVSVKLIFSTYSHTLLGAQLMGSDSIGEMINMISVLILNKMSDMDINTLQIGTHPLLTSSPIAYPVINATTDTIKKWYSYYPY